MREAVDTRTCDQCGRRQVGFGGKADFFGWYQLIKVPFIPIDLCSDECVVTYINKGREENKVAD